MDNILKRVSWRENENAIEISFEFYLDLLEKRIEYENICNKMLLSCQI